MTATSEVPAQTSKAQWQPAEAKFEVHGVKFKIVFNGTEFFVYCDGKNQLKNVGGAFCGAEDKCQPLLFSHEEASWRTFDALPLLNATPEDVCELDVTLGFKGEIGWEEERGLKLERR